MRYPLSLFGFLLILIGCSVLEPQEVIYLHKVKDHATQEDVTQRFGQPVATKPLDGGGAQWTYQFPYWDYGDRNTPARQLCDAYVLTFDSNAVLRRWVRRGCTNKTAAPFSP
jgi:hypothetical protein